MELERHIKIGILSEYLTLVNFPYSNERKYMFSYNSLDKVFPLSINKEHLVILVKSNERTHMYILLNKEEWLSISKETIILRDTNLFPRHQTIQEQDQNRLLSVKPNTGLNYRLDIIKDFIQYARPYYPLDIMPTIESSSKYLLDYEARRHEETTNRSDDI